MQESQAPALATIDAHVAALREALVETNAYLVVGTRFIDWLELAAGLLDVEIDTGRHDALLMMCGRAREWHSSRSDELARMPTELTRFLYVWCALECLARAAQLTRRVGDDDMLDHAAMREHLIHRLTRLPLPSGFEGVVDKLRRAVARHPDFGERFVRRLAVSEAYPTCVLGLTAATELRNHFAHGSIVNPDPSEWGRPRAGIDRDRGAHRPRVDLHAADAARVVQLPRRGRRRALRRRDRHVPSPRRTRAAAHCSPAPCCVSTALWTAWPRLSAQRAFPVERVSFVDIGPSREESGEKTGSQKSVNKKEQKARATGLS